MKFFLCDFFILFFLILIVNYFKKLFLSHEKDKKYYFRSR